MISCVECKAPNLENRLFCGQCGIKMVFSCPQCHFINHSGEHYCGGCGASFSAPPSPKSFLYESAPAPMPASASNLSSGNKKSPALSSQAIKEFLNIQKGSQGKKKEAKDEKKQVSQEEIERLIHEGIEKGKNS
jgi:hypothetical protein